MLTLLTALALNIPGNPTKFECHPVDQSSVFSDQCVKFENQSPQYRLTFTCVGEGFYSGTIIVFPNAGTVVQRGNVFNCTINKVDIL